MPKKIRITGIILLSLCLLVGCMPVNSSEEGPSLPSSSNILGVYLGTFHGVKSPSVTLFEKIGKNVAISAAYPNFSSAFPNGFVLGNANVGRIADDYWIDAYPGMLP